jgi:uncharacterized membrane protein
LFQATITTESAALREEAATKGPNDDHVASQASTDEHGGRYPRLRREEREVEFARVLAFSDGVFAIAITLLVLQLEVPADVKQLGSELDDQLPDLFAYCLSFAVLGRVWWAFHHRLFSGLAEFDGVLIALNFLYLGLAVLVPFSSELMGDYGGEREAVVIYAANIGLLTLSGALMAEYAVRRGLMRPGAAEGATGPASYLITAVFLLSIPVAFVSPLAASLIWLTTFIGRYGLGRARAKRSALDG